MRTENRPCPLPRAGVLAARPVGRALNPGRVTRLPDPRTQPALCLRHHRLQAMPEFIKTAPRPCRSWGSRRCCLREEAPSPAHRTPPLFHLEAGPFPAATLANQRAELARRSANQMPNTRPTSRSVAEPLCHACACPSRLPGVGVPFRRTKASQTPKAKEGREQKGEKRSASS